MFLLSHHSHAERLQSAAVFHYFLQSIDYINCRLVLHVTNTITFLSVFARYLDAHNQRANPLLQIKYSYFGMVFLICHCRTQWMTGARATKDAAVGIFAEYEARKRTVSRLKSWLVCWVNLNRITSHFSHNGLNSDDQTKPELGLFFTKQSWELAHPIYQEILCPFFILINTSSLFLSSQAFLLSFDQNWKMP